LYDAIEIRGRMARKRARSVVFPAGDVAAIEKNKTPAGERADGRLGPVHEGLGDWAEKPTGREPAVQ
jgi:hypothetical protein